MKTVRRVCQAAIYAVFYSKGKWLLSKLKPNPDSLSGQNTFELENPVRNHIKRSRRPSTSSTDQSLLDQTDIMDLDRGHNPLDGAQAQGSNSSESF